MKYLFSCLLLSMLCTISVAQPVKEAPIKNPMLWADVPNPDARRTGNGIERSEKLENSELYFR